MVEQEYYENLKWIDAVEPDRTSARLMCQRRRKCGAPIAGLGDFVNAIIAGDVASRYESQVFAWLERGLITEGEARELAERAKLTLEPGGQV